MATMRSPALGGLTGAILLFVLLGFPLLAFLWETLNELFSGQVDSTRLLLSIPVLVVFAALLVWLARVVARWSRTTSPSTVTGADDAD